MTSFKKGESNDDELFDDENNEDKDDSRIDFDSIHKRSMEIHSRKSNIEAGGRILKTTETN